MNTFYIYKTNVCAFRYRNMWAKRVVETEFSCITLNPDFFFLAIFLSLSLSHFACVCVHCTFRQTEVMCRCDLKHNIQIRVVFKTGVLKLITHMLCFFLCILFYALNQGPWPNQLWKAESWGSFDFFLLKNPFFSRAGPIIASVCECVFCQMWNMKGWMDGWTVAFKLNMNALIKSQNQAPK